MRQNAVVIHSQRTFDELEVFIWKGIKAEEMQGYNDDLVMALAIGLWTRDTALKLRANQDGLTRAAIDNFHHGSQYNETYTPSSPIGDPFKMYVGGPGNTAAVEDLRWLLE